MRGSRWCWSLIALLLFSFEIGGGYTQAISSESLPQALIFVAEFNNQRVQVLDNTGNFIREFGCDGSGNGEFANPVGIAVDNDANIYVADLGDHRVQVFDNSGNFLKSFGSLGFEDGQF